ncbi:metallophosphoesterase [Methanothrix soehngenii]|uniref:metallophosphoesterase n=1 Tax=Methanothrix soehngenii TaxID=2223 RepID=UPI002A35F2B0|nr:metallophosphoesterase [Methanothrix soehngenii]MDY0412659.1 metallophosphoesterase [Methanothrix soehngenii]
MSAPDSDSPAYSIAPVFGAPLLLAEGKERLLIASDLHLGLEHELWLGGVSIPSQTRKILALLKGYLDMIMPDRLLILGDLKHNVPKTSWQEKREVPDFLRQLSAQVRVDIVSGNHDSNLADMAPLGVRVHPSTGIVREGRGYFHGHTWPEEKVVRSGFMVAAHLHPAVRLKDPLGNFQTHPVWARAPIQTEVVEEHYGFASSGEIIIMPAFNPLCGGLALNEPAEDMRGPLPAMANMEHARLYLLDGTDLGLLAEIKAAGDWPI